ncbi:RNA polymerase subunit sigma-70 [Saccharobesus litoralis]|uniref:RNA polymerase subunit sigma-70 n=1 Tax=Saccharobesus litoralis TaxID=2172099 RepID=A0A2S0VT28_9ALTE|nr:biopolymer transporter ExbD [Saccharobesus litoralis]AWB67365.1 RNA polymerase subunit sigma-70 [Saccharobesus litoralis]
MRQSKRAQRLAKHHKRYGSAGKLNLVSLMDIFTILVFFLIVNQSEVRVLQNVKEINLPVSVAEELPKENLLISVFNDVVLVQDRSIWQNTSNGEGLTEENTGQLVAALKQELAYQTQRRPELTDSEKQKGRAVTIIGDSSIPYEILKQIMAACAEADYRDMSLAVEQLAKNGQEAS